MGSHHPFRKHTTAVQREVNEWVRARAEEDRLTPLDEACRCGVHSVRGPTYLGQPSCKICHKFLQKING